MSVVFVVAFVNTLINNYNYVGLLLYRGTYLFMGQGKHTKLTSEIYSTLVAL